MKVLALAGYDSFLNTVRLISPYFEQQGASVELGVVKARQRKQISAEQIARMPLTNPVHHVKLDRLCQSSEIRNYDIILSSLEGLSTRRLFFHLAELGAERPLVVSVYPGLLLRHSFNGLAMRAPADRLWLNCERDVQDYASMCQAFGIDSSNVRLFGNASLLENISRKRDAEGRAPLVFFEQVNIPKHYAERKFLIAKLCDLALKYPERDVLIKARAPGKWATLHKTWYPVEDILNDLAKNLGRLPSNLSLTTESAHSLLSKAAFCLTVSSTVAIEAIYAGVPTAIVCDIGADDDYGLQYFYASGLLRKISEIDPLLPPICNPDWLAKHSHDPHNSLSELVADCLANAKAPKHNLNERSVGMGSQEFQKTLVNGGAEYYLTQRYKSHTPRAPAITGLLKKLWPYSR